MARSSLEYAFTPNKDEVTLRFLTQTDNGDVVVTLEMDEDQQTLTPFHFGDVWFQDGKKLTVTQGKWSNVAFGRVNNDNGKTLLIGYYEDERKINAPVDVQLVSGLKSLIGLTFSPSGPVTANGDPTFHEIELQTTGNNDLAQFILKSVGYVEKTVSAKRFDGNLTNMEYDKIVFSSLIKNYGFSASNPSFSYKVPMFETQIKLE